MSQRQQHFDFTTDFQDTLLACAVRHPEEFTDIVPRLDYGYFTGNASQSVAQSCTEYAKENDGYFPTFTVLGDLVRKKTRSTQEEVTTLLAYVSKLSEIDTRDFRQYIARVGVWLREAAVTKALSRLMTEFRDGRIEMGENFVTRIQEALDKSQPSELEGENALDLAQSEIDHASTIISNLRALARGGAMLVPAPTGIGKSAWMMQVVYGAACGVETLGMKFTRPLKVLVVQAENDRGDMIEMSRGALLGMDKLNDAQMELIKTNTVMVHHCQHTGDEFLGFLRALLRKHKPDLLFIDPLNAYVGADVSKAETIATFCRNGLNPLLQQYACAAIILHHQNKPPTEGRDTKGMNHVDFRYRYAGSAELGNWARATMVIEPTDHPAIFRFILAKRGKRFGWTDAHGNPTSERYFMHSPDKIYWTEPGIAELAELQELTMNKKRAKREAGVAETYTDEELLAPLEEDALTVTQWHKVLRAEGSTISMPRLSQRKDTLLAKCKVRQEGSKFTLVKRPGRQQTNEPKNTP